LKCFPAHHSNTIVAVNGKAISISAGQPCVYQIDILESVDVNTCQNAASVINNATGKWYV